MRFYLLSSISKIKPQDGEPMRETWPAVGDGPLGLRLPWLLCNLIRCVLDSESQRGFDSVRSRRDDVPVALRLVFRLGHSLGFTETGQAYNLHITTSGLVINTILFC